MNTKSLAIVGTQWGDEGKGKITDYYAAHAEMVVRYQGGNNAGHTIKFDNKEFSLNLLPSGIFNPNITNVLASGTVIDVIQLVKEIKRIEEQGIKDYQLFISDKAHVIFPYHIQMDGMFEDLKTEENKIGTTRKGIGPTYSDKALRDGIRICDLLNAKKLASKIKDNLAIKNKIFTAFGLKTFTFEEIYQPYYDAGQFLKSKITDTSRLVENFLKANKKVLFEGAQGVMLCLDHGTYPFVTSSSPTSSSIPYNVGISPKLLSNTLGVVKAYSTRVGAGAFPSELQDQTLANDIRIKGNEFGTVTKRPRRIGWFDAVILRHAIRTSGIDFIAVTLLDVLSGLKEIEIVDSYLLEGKKIDFVPSDIEIFEQVEPVTFKMPGWEEDITQVKSFDELPQNAKNYLLKLEEILEVKISTFSVGPDRSQTIEIKEVF